MKAIGTRILVQVEKKDSCMQKIGNLVTPIETFGYEIAKVISVGEEVKTGVISVGDTVYIYQGAGKEFRTHGPEAEMYRVVTTSEVIVVL